MTRLSQRDRVRILLVDDHPLVRIALRDLILRQDGLAVCGEADDRRGALAAIAASKPHLVITDLALRDSEGLELIRDIHRRHPKIRILVLSMYDESLYAERVVRAGACGYISKEEATTKVLEAVRKILGGEIYWSEKVAANVASKVACAVGTLKKGRPVDLLSERELEIFELVGKGASTEQIAAYLHIGSSTVETYRSRIKRKMALKSGVELLQAAIGWKMAGVVHRHRQW